jgi:hypothetical protein
MPTPNHPSSPCISHDTNTQPLDLASTLPMLFGGSSAASSPKKQKPAASLAASKTQQLDSPSKPQFVAQAESPGATRAAALAVSRLVGRA